MEKHFTLDRTMSGPDHPFAVEPDELRDMVAGIRDAQAALGDGRKDGPSPEEREEMFPLGRRSLIAARDLPAGTLLERDMITTKRPGFGIAPKHLELVLGRTLKVDVEARRHPALGHALDEFAHGRDHRVLLGLGQRSGSTAATGSRRSRPRPRDTGPGA